MLKEGLGELGRVLLEKASGLPIHVYKFLVGPGRVNMMEPDFSQGCSVKEVEAKGANKK